MSGPYGDYGQPGEYPQYENVPPPVNPPLNPAAGHGLYPPAGVSPYPSPYIPQQVNPAGHPPAHAGAPAYAPAFYVRRTTNGMAIASMVLGIVWVYWIGSILALIFGYVARQQIKERDQAGDGMAIAGIVLGWVGIGIFAIMMLSVARAFSF